MRLGETSGLAGGSASNAAQVAVVKKADAQQKAVVGTILSGIEQTPISREAFGTGKVVNVKA